jgi:hypothetical protein
MTMGADIGVACGACGSEVHMISCPTHAWTVMSVCTGCSREHLVAPTCKECEWPRTA